MPDPKKQVKKQLLTEAFDVMFIMLLCFFTLLSAMLMRGTVLVGQGQGGMVYTFSIATFSLTALALLGYLLYILIQSDKELQQMISHLYGQRKQVKNI